MATQDDKTSHRGRIQEARTRQSKAVEVVVDGDTTTLKNVLLLGKNSTNRRDYSDEALRAAVPMFEESEVFVGHTRDGSNPTFDRSMGITRNPMLAQDGIRGDHSFPTKHRLAEDLVWRATHAPKGLGYSIDADTAWNYDSKGRQQVHAIERLYSTDLVTRPATSKGMTEDEEVIPDDQRKFAEHVFSALSDCRSIMLDPDSTAVEKRQRLLEEITVFHGEVWEGEIADEMAENKPLRDMREAHDIASRKLDEARWSSDKFPKHHDKIRRHIEVLKDHIKTLSSIQCTCPECGGKSKTQEETSNMEFKELTIDTLTKERPDLVSVLKGTDEHTRLTEEAKTAKTQLEAAQAEVARLQGLEASRVKESEIAAELTAVKFPTGDKAAFSTRFQEDLKRAKDKAERAEIIKDRMSLLQGRVQEQGLPSPLAQFNDAGGQQTATSGINPAHDHLFGKK